MQFMMLVVPEGYQRAAPGTLPSAELVAAMSKYNEELSNAGVLRGLNGLRPGSEAVRISFAKGKGTATDGPFSETKELVGGYWIIEVASKAQAVEWALKAPMQDGDIIEIRQISGPEDFPPELQEAGAGRAPLDLG
jgi:hypothetical protein